MQLQHNVDKELKRLSHQLFVTHDDILEHAAERFVSSHTGALGSKSVLDV
jgi:hypothetical protein